MTIEIIPSEGDIGALIYGIDIAKSLTPKEIATIEQALVVYQVLVFRNQPLGDREFADFSAQFGPLRTHIQAAFRHPTIPEIVYNRNVDENGNFDEAGASRGVTLNLKYGWHSDTYYEEEASAATSVHALEVPTTGGKTHALPAATAPTPAYLKA